MLFNSKPSIIRFIIVCMIVYVSGYIVANITGNITNVYVLYEIFWLLFFSFVFTAGLISIWNEFKCGLFKLLKRQIKIFLYKII